MKIKNKFHKRKVKHGVKIVGIVLAILLLLFAVKILDLRLTGYAVWTTSNTTNWTVGVWNNTLVNQTTGAVSLFHGNASELNWTDNIFGVDNGLVLYMKFNNNSAIDENSSYAVDMTGINNGTFGNTTANNVARPNWTSSTAGKLGGALSFDGKNDFVNASDSNSLDLTTTF